MISSSYNLTHLKVLEAESIHIIREVAAEFERPVMLYSIGKDSAVMLRLAQKAFHPGRLPFPLLHVDTTWKFRAMIEFRDRYCREQGLDLKVWIYAAAVIPAGLAGLWAAGHLFRRISRDMLLRAVALMLLASGASLIVRALA